MTCQAKNDGNGWARRVNCAPVEREFFHHCHRKGPPEWLWWFMFSAAGLALALIRAPELIIELLSGCFSLEARDEARPSGHRGQVGRTGSA